MSIKLAPCSYCNRKPGFYSNGINYCWVHWYDQKNNVKMKEENLKYYKKLILKINKDDFTNDYKKIILKVKNNQSKKIITKSI